GRVYILPERSQIAHAVEAELIAARRFRFSRIAIDEHLIELLSGNRICGATDICGFCWHVETAAEAPRLFFEAHGHPVSVMERGDDGVWRGAEIVGLQAVVEMVPECKRRTDPIRLKMPAAASHNWLSESSTSMRRRHAMRT